MKTLTKELCENWKVIHDHDTLTFTSFRSALAYAKGYAKASETLEIVDPTRKEIVLLSDMNHLAIQLAA
jgi:hypothetical protein